MLTRFGAKNSSQKGLNYDKKILVTALLYKFITIVYQYSHYFMSDITLTAFHSSKK